MPSRTRRQRRKAQVPTAVARAGRAVDTACRLPSRIDDFVRPLAWWAGWIGFLLLAGCAVLSLTPTSEWPRGLVRAHLPVYVMVSLALASLVGWAFVQEGQGRIARTVGRRTAAVLFVFLPVVCAGLGLLASWNVVSPLEQARTPEVWTFVRWYSPGAVLASLAAFLLRKARPGSTLRPVRGAWFAFLVTPYVLLLAYLVLGVESPWLHGPLHQTMQSLGSWAIALQLVLAWFVGSSGS